MQDMPSPPDTGFVVDWQIADHSPVIDLATAENEVILPDDTTLQAALGRGLER